MRTLTIFVRYFPPFLSYSFNSKHYTTSSKNLVDTITTINVYFILYETRIVYFPLGHSKNILMHLYDLYDFMTLIPFMMFDDNLMSLSTSSHLPCHVFRTCVCNKKFGR